MVSDVLRALYGYTSWATARLLDVSGQLTQEQWLAPGGAGRGPIRDTLVHLIDTQRSWLAWWDGSLPPEQAYALRLTPADFPGPPAVRAVWETVDRTTPAFVATLTDADAAKVSTQTMPDGRVFRLPRWQIMLHVANHGTQHRNEVAAMLTSHGHSPGDLDALWYFRPFGDAPAG
jgi:uncharacterized damage-inducible protein DinB